MQSNTAPRRGKNLQKNFSSEKIGRGERNEPFSSSELLIASPTESLRNPVKKVGSKRE
jgi:hypothetical protein